MKKHLTVFISIWQYLSNSYRKTTLKLLLAKNTLNWAFLFDTFTIKSIIITKDAYSFKRLRFMPLPNHAVSSALKKRNKIASNYFCYFSQIFDCQTFLLSFWSNACKILQKSSERFYCVAPPILLPFSFDQIS